MGAVQVPLDNTTADIEFVGKTVNRTIVFEEANAEPLLGMQVLKSVHIESEPRNAGRKQFSKTLEFLERQDE